MYVRVFNYNHWLKAQESKDEPNKEWYAIMGNKDRKDILIKDTNIQKIIDVVKNLDFETVVYLVDNQGNQLSAPTLTKAGKHVKHVDLSWICPENRLEYIFDSIQEGLQKLK